jgi:hypothetical protein
MTTDQSRSGPLDVTLTGEPLTIGARTLRPVARLRGWRGRGGDATAHGAVAFVQLRPVAVEVTEAGHAAYTVPVVDPTAAPLRAMAVAAVAIAAVAALLALLVRWRSAG